MANETDSFGRRLQRAFSRLLVFCLLTALLAAVAFLLSQLNARRFKVTNHDGMLVILKGRPLPLGTQPYQPVDPRLRETYAPLALHGTDPGPLTERTFEDRDELDRALFELLRALAEPRLQEESSERLQEGLVYLQRAALLQGISPDQRQTLTRMQTDIAYYRARSLLAQAQKLIADGVEQLAVAARTDNPHTRSAQQMLLEVEGPARSLDEGLRRAVHQLSSPPPTPPPAAIDGGT